MRLITIAQWQYPRRTPKPLRRCEHDSLFQMQSAARQSLEPDWPQARRRRNAGPSAVRPRRADGLVIAKQAEFPHLRSPGHSTVRPKDQSD
jgi:hypothetical protein